MTKGVITQRNALPARRFDDDSAMRMIEIMGTPLALTSYEELGAWCLARAQAEGVHAVDFTNTHIVTLRRHESNFHSLTHHFELFVPDGMPLVWCLNQRGARLTDRVYGPAFMRRFLETAPTGSRHYLLGGSDECGRRLRARFPAVDFVGSFHGRSSREGILEGAADDQVLEEINRLAPDFIWIGLGTPKQYGWIKRNRSRLKRGLLLSVGFAFDVNAGMKPDAPLWMQKAGLTWLFRLVSEPRRLTSRYLHFNSLFLFYLWRDEIRRRS